MCFNSEQEQKVKAQLCQTHSLMDREQSANTATVKVSHHLIHSEADIMDINRLNSIFLLLPVTACLMNKLFVTAV